jgi:streptomycin 3"-adenylyltransferase
VSRRPTGSEEKRGLAAGLLGISGRPRAVEVTVVAEPDLSPWRYPPRFDFQFGEWLRADVEAGRAELGPTTNPDVSLLLTMARQRSRPLLGPPADELLPSVPAADLTRALQAGAVEALPGLEDETRNSVLTLARIWRTLETGEIVAKDEAADWALERLPAELEPVLARARAIYLGDEEEGWDELRPLVGPYGDYLADEIRRA